MSNRTTIRENESLLFALFETMLSQQRKIGYRADDDAEYPRQDRAASRADVVVQLRKERVE